MRSLATALIFATALFGLGFSLAFTATPQRPAQTTFAEETTPPPSSGGLGGYPAGGTPQPWQLQATGEAAASQAAAAYTAVSESTRAETQRRATATMQRQLTQESQEATPLAATAAWLQQQVSAQQTAIARSARLTAQADAAAAQQTAAAATQQTGATATTAAIVAAENARREANATTAQMVTAALDPLVQIAKAVALIVAVLVLVWAAQELLPIVKLRLEARARLNLSGPAPMQAIEGPNKQIIWVLVTTVPPTLSASQSVIDQPTSADPKARRDSRVPLRLAAHPDNPQWPLKQRILNLLAVSMEHAGLESHVIPRYDKINFDPAVRGQLAHALAAAGHVSINHATVLLNGETLYSLYSGLDTGRLSLSPTPSTALQNSPAPSDPTPIPTTPNTPNRGC